MKSIKITLSRAWKDIALAGMLLTLLHQSVVGQNLPIVYATSTKVDIRDGGVLQKSVWNLSPEIKPDVYYSLESEHTRKVTFYTDIDSISFDVAHHTNYDFLVVLNKVDTCYTRIAGGEPKQRVVRTMLTPDQVQEDFMLLVESIQREHGDATRYKTESELKELCLDLFEKLDHPMDQYEFGMTVRYLISAIQNGHTGMSLPDELMTDYEEQVKMFPIQLWFSEDKALVACDRIEELPVGTEIMAIDGVPVHEIKEKLFQYIKSDGKIESKKFLMLNYSGFPFLYSWLYGEKDSYYVEYRSLDGAIASKTIDADYVSNSQCLSVERKFDKNLQLDHLADDVSLLTIRSFHSRELMRTDEDFPEFLAASFKEIRDRNVKTLILDLRNNSGGDDANGALLYSYLTDKPFRFFSLQDTVSPPQLPARCGFTGKVIFLINGLSFSTTSNFAAIAKSNGRGELVGDETGGAYYGGSAGETYVTVLPNSHIRVTIPKESYDNPVRPMEEKGNGVIPDYLVQPTLEEVIQHVDVQLNYAVDLARNRE